MVKEKVCGIYCIKNLINNKMYIGLSTNIYTRWDSHRNMLNRNDHFNIFLQRSWNKYKENNFKFSIIEICIEDELSQKEIYYIKLYDANNDKYGYNLSSGGDKPKINEESLIRKSLKYSKRVLQFAKDGLFIAEHLNSHKVGELYKVSPSAIHQCCLGNTKSAYGYIWKFKEDCCDIVSKLNDNTDIPNLYYIAPVSKIVYQIDLEGNFLKEWYSCDTIGEFYNIVSENIRSCCDKKYGRKTYIGYMLMIIT